MIQVTYMVAMCPFGLGRGSFLLLLASSVLSAEVESTATVEEYQQGQHVLEIDGLTHSPYQADLDWSHIVSWFNLILILLSSLVFGLGYYCGSRRTSRSSSRRDHLESHSSTEEFHQPFSANACRMIPCNVKLSSSRSDVFHVYDCQAVKQTLHPSTLRICKHCLEMHETRSYVHNVHKRHD